MGGGAWHGSSMSSIMLSIYYYYYYYHYYYYCYHYHSSYYYSNRSAHSAGPGLKNDYLKIVFKRAQDPRKFFGGVLVTPEELGFRIRLSLILKPNSSGLLLAVQKL